MFKDRSFISLVLFLLSWCWRLLYDQSLFRSLVLPLSSDQALPKRRGRGTVLGVEDTWKTRFDMILMGDSRVYRGLSPEAMKSVLSDYRIFNFGYSGGGLDPVMYRRQNAGLIPTADIRASFLALLPLHSPHMLRRTNIICKSSTGLRTMFFCVFIGCRWYIRSRPWI